MTDLGYDTELLKILKYVLTTTFYDLLDGTNQIKIL